MLRVLLRTTLSRYLDEIAPAEWIFTKNHYGKPAIQNPVSVPLQFSLSHTEGMVVLAVTLGQDVSVDAEWVGRDSHPMEIAEQCFSAQEIEQLHALPVEQQRDRFFAVWTLKEAWMKAYGLGLSIPLDQVSVTFSPDQTMAIRVTSRWHDPSDHWWCWPFNQRRRIRSPSL